MEATWEFQWHFHSLIPQGQGQRKVVQQRVFRERPKARYSTWQRDVFTVIDQASPDLSKLRRIFKGIHVRSLAQVPARQYLRYSEVTQRDLIIGKSRHFTRPTEASWPQFFASSAFAFRAASIAKLWAASLLLTAAKDSYHYYVMATPAFQFISHDAMPHCFLLMACMTTFWNLFASQCTGHQNTGWSCPEVVFLTQFFFAALFSIILMADRQARWFIGRVPH